MHSLTREAIFPWLRHWSKHRRAIFNKQLLKLQGWACRDVCALIMSAPWWNCHHLPLHSFEEYVDISHKSTLMSHHLRAIVETASKYISSKKQVRHIYLAKLELCKEDSGKEEVMQLWEGSRAGEPGIRASEWLLVLITFWGTSWKSEQSWWNSKWVNLAV